MESIHDTQNRIKKRIHTAWKQITGLKRRVQAQRVVIRNYESYKAQQEAGKGVLPFMDTSKLQKSIELAAQDYRQAVEAFIIFETKTAEASGDSDRIMRIYRQAAVISMEKLLSEKVK